MEDFLWGVCEQTNEPAEQLWQIVGIIGTCLFTERVQYDHRTPALTGRGRLRGSQQFLHHCPHTYIIMDRQHHGTTIVYFLQNVYRHIRKQNKILQDLTYHVFADCYLIASLNNFFSKIEHAWDFSVSFYLSLLWCVHFTTQGGQKSWQDFRQVLGQGISSHRGEEWESSSIDRRSCQLQNS